MGLRYSLVPTILQLLGLVVLVVAGFVVSFVVGLALLGLVLLGVGYLLERPRKG